MFTLTANAARQVRAAAAASQAGGLALRVAARLGDDGTLLYGMGFDEVVDGDAALEIEGVTVAIAPSSLALLEGTALDFVEYAPGDLRFIFIPPAAAELPRPVGPCGGGCGCGPREAP
jgi:Fe-S cluster assembly iron-binding protein IscA